jgi:hypothetical protein
MPNFVIEREVPGTGKLLTQVAGFVEIRTRDMCLMPYDELEQYEAIPFVLIWRRTK